MGGTFPAVVDTFRLEHCPACSYDLTGLPAEGVCPECGESYDMGTIELTGTALGVHETLANAPDERFRRRMLPWTVGGIAFFIFWLCLVFSSGPIVYGVFVPIALVLALTWGNSAIRFVRRVCVGRSTVRLRMNAVGIVQDDDVEEPPAIASLRTAMPYLNAALFVGLVGWMARSELRAVALILVMGISPNVWSWVRNWRARRAVRRVRDGKLLTSTARRHVLVPRGWTDVASINIGTEDTGVCRIVATARLRTAATKGDVADIEVPCTPDQAKQLRDRVAAWRKAARETER